MIMELTIINYISSGERRISESSTVAGLFCIWIMNYPCGENLP